MVCWCWIEYLWVGAMLQSAVLSAVLCTQLWVDYTYKVRENAGGGLLLEWMACLDRFIIIFVLVKFL